MANWLDMMLPQNTGLNSDQMRYARAMGFLNAGTTLADMSAPQYGPKATPLQLITHGVADFRTGGQNAVDQFYTNDINRSKSAAALVQEAADKDNLEWFNKGKPSSFMPPSPTTTPATIAPTLKSFYTGSDGVTPFQIAAESSGNPNAISPKGAEGLMQLMPDTQKDPGFGVQPLQNNSPEENVRMGVDYRNALQKKYGNLDDALIAYNWGPGNTDKWIADGRDESKLPTETKNYVAQIYKGMQEANPSVVNPTASPTTQQPGGIENKAFAQHLYELAEMQMRSNRPGAEALLRVASLYDPNLARVNSQGLPSAIQIADELKKARAAGDQQRINDLTLTAKIYDKGFMGDNNGGVTVIPGYTGAVHDKSYAEGSGGQEGKNDADRMNKQADIVAKMPLLESDLATYEQKLSQVDPALMGPIRGKAAYYLSPEIQDLTSTARSIALQLKDIYNLGSGQGFTDADRDYLDSIIGGAKVDPAAALPILKDMHNRIAMQRDVYKQTTDYYNENQNLRGFIPTAPTQNNNNSDGWNTTPGGTKYRIVQ